MFDVVRYLTTQGELPPARLTGYDYITAGNGLFKRAMNRHLECCLSLAPARVAGLPEIRSYVRLRAGRIPGQVLEAILVDARRLAWKRPIEAMYHLVRNGDRVRLVRPVQEGTGASLSYQGGDSPAIICELHSHCQMNAFFSGTDDRDELGFRFYAVIGQIFSRRPTIALRLGVYGDHWSFPAETVFTHRGPFEEETWKFRSVTPSK